ncbi:MAG TPA: ABC transporter substrate-binding protein [Roseomonas sp.]|jgi:peptide/nickel transport system substrate-binding protein
MRLSRRLLLGQGAALAALPSLPLAAAPAGTLRFVPQADIQVLDPVVSTNYNTRNCAYMIWDTLFALDAAFRPQPQMVERWSVSADGLTYDFALRDGLLWHDRQPVRAADCVASIRRWARKSPIGLKLMEVAASLDAVDARSFRLVLKEPFGQVVESLATLSGYVPFMMPERLAATDPATPIREIIGSGPFRFVPEEWDAGNKLVFLRNADYRPRAEPASLAAGGKVVHVERVEWVSIPDAATAANALTTGEVDWYELPPFDLLPLLRRNRGVTVANIDTLGSQALMRFNHLIPPFDNPLARQAVAAAISQSDYMQALAGDQSNWRSCYSVYACGLPMSTEAGTDALRAPRDLERARALLRQSGYRGERVVVLSVAEIPAMQAMALVTVDLLQRIGFNVELAATDQGAFFQRRTNRGPVEQGGWNVFNTWIIAVDTANPAISMALQANGLNGYAGWPSNPDIEALRAQWLRATDAGTQQRIAAEVQERTLANLNFIPVGQFYLPTAYRRGLSGVISSPIPFFWNVEKR